MGIFARKNKNPKNYHLTNVKYLGSLPSVAQKVLHAFRPIIPNLTRKTSELQDIAIVHKIDFNKLVSQLHREIENNIEIIDFNSMNIAWIIIAYFFELCDVGVDEIC